MTTENLNLIDYIVCLLLRLNGTEAFLHRYQGYRSNSCVQWKKQNNLDWIMVRKIIKKIEIFDGPRIRSIISNLVKQNPNVFNGTCYVAAFGKTGKSGEVIMYEFNHSVKTRKGMLVKVSDLPRLPSHSTIVFVEDLIGTGKQSLDYITERLNLLLKPSHIPYLLTLCATPEAVNKVQDNTNFTVLTGVELNEKEYQHYTAASTYFNPNEKNKLIKLNGSLKDPTKFDYDRGLLLAFYYSMPNNSMPILWKEGFPYINHKGERREWFAVLPRQF